MRRKLRIGLVGGGIGGLTAALALACYGFEVHVFEQASELREVGAGLGISPNAVKVLRALGLGPALKARGFQSAAIVGRDWTTGYALFRVALGDAAECRFGAASVQVHRADLLDVLADAARMACEIHLNARCVAISLSDHVARLTLSNGGQHEFDLLVGCDGIHSFVRGALHGHDAPRYTGNMCWRALIPAHKLPPRHVPPHTTIWMGPGGHVVTYYVRGGALVNVVAIREASDWVEESWSIAAPTSELVQAFPGVHGDLRTLLEHAEHCSNGDYSIATRCSGGVSDALLCWVMPPILCCRSWDRAPLCRSKMPMFSPASSRAVQGM